MSSQTVTIIGKNMTAIDEHDVEHDLFKLLQEAPQADLAPLAGMSLADGDCFWLGERYFEVRSC
jgi:hypothetical protein